MKTALLLLLIAAPAAATPTEMVPAPTPAQDDGWVAREFELGATLFGLVNGSFLTEPSEADKYVVTPDGRRASGVPYPGFGGVGGGGGASIVGAWRGILGVELQLFDSLDQGSGDINNVEFTIGQTAWHLGLLMRVGLPTTHVRPYLFGGPEFVFPSEAELTFTKTQPQAVQDLVGATADDYIAWAMGIGAEFVLPGDYDLRIPLALRFVLNPTVSDIVEDRTVNDITCPSPSQPCRLNKQTFVSEWQYQVAVQLGFAWYFL